MPIRALIADDMLLARKRVRRHLEPHDDIEIAGEASGGREAVEMIRALEPQLLFLDVQMPEVGGFDVLEEVGPDAVPAVIFVTAYDQFALKAFDVHALDYLLKPFDAERFEVALARAKTLIARQKSEGAAGKLRALLDQIGGGARHPRRLVIKADGRTMFLPVEDIDYIEAAGNYVRLHVGTTSHLLRETMNAIEGRLDPEKFFRIHRSRIVNMERIQEMQPWLNGEYAVVLRTGTRLTLSRGYREKLQERLARTV